jgi:hypothetical protein
VPPLFSDALKRSAFRAANGEYGWTAKQAREVVEILRARDLAVLGGELWWVPEGSATWVGSIPQREGADAVYAWETKRRRNETWSRFVERCASDTLAAVKRWPPLEDLPESLPGRILYNLTWVDEAEYGELGKRKA